MSAFTLDYLAGMEAWGFGAAAVQGVLVALSWAAWSRLTAASADARHRLACLHFAALAVLPVATLAIVQGTVAHAAATVPCACARSADAVRAPVAALALVALWLAGVAVMGGRLARDATRLARLRLRPAPAALASLIQALSPGVAVFEAAVASPQVVGLRRPRLIVPVGVADALAADELDAVLRHELVHLARADFAWNLAQRFLLVGLWFHSAAWLLYARVGREREVRCDALAVRAGASAAALARALVRLAEPRAAPPLAMALLDRSELSLRLRRLLAPPRPAPGRTGWALVASALCLATLAVGRFAALDLAIRDAYIASAFGPTITVQGRDPAGPFAVRIRRGRVVAASLGPEHLPRGRIRQAVARVTLQGARQPSLALTVSPQGSIFWNART